MSNHPSELTSVGLEDLVKSISAPRFGQRRVKAGVRDIEVVFCRFPFFVAESLA